MRSFTDELRDLRGGELAMELTDRMAEVITAVDQHRKPATLTLTLTVRPASASSSAQIITDKVVLKLPEKLVNETIVFPMPEGSFLLNNPKQGTLTLSAAPSPALPHDVVAPIAVPLAPVAPTAGPTVIAPPAAPAAL